MTQDEIEARGEFTPRTQGEIDRNLFAAKVGGLVSIGGAAFWELYYAAKAWHRHVQNENCEGTGAREAREAAGGEESARILQGARDTTGGGQGNLGEGTAGGYTVTSVSPLGPQARDTETCAPTAQARDTTPSEEA